MLTMQQGDPQETEAERSHHPGLSRERSEKTPDKVNRQSNDADLDDDIDRADGLPPGILHNHELSANLVVEIVQGNILHRGIARQR